MGDKMSQDNLKQAIAKAKSGDRRAGRQLLSKYVRENPSDETGWLWLSVCVSSLEQKRFCLNKALSINPQNKHALKALEELDNLPPPQPSFAELSDNHQNVATQKPRQPKEPNSPPTHENQDRAPDPRPRTKMPVVSMRQVGEYVKSVLLPKEVVLAVGKIHWVIFMPPAIFLAFSLLLTIFFALPGMILWIGAGDASLLTSWITLICIFPLWAVAGLGFLKAYLTARFTEFALTDKRLIGKTGVVRTNSLELVLGKVESISVNQGLFGRIFDYGTLVVSGSGGTHQPIPFIANPMLMKKKINEIVGG
jgi:hypothetical protein